MTINFVFKNGFVLPMKCESFENEQNVFGMINKWSAKGITKNKPLSMDMAEVVCIYRNMDDEENNQ